MIEAEIGADQQDMKRETQPTAAGLKPKLPRTLTGPTENGAGLLKNGATKVDSLVCSQPTLECPTIA